jgi:hypothetical protein
MPKNEDPEPVMTMTPELFASVVSDAVKAALGAVAPTTPVTAEMIATAVRAANEGQAELHAGAMKRALKPENDPAPMMSVFNPEGDRDHPRPKLKCEFTLFDGIPIDGTTDTVEELTLMNQLVAGDYWVEKADGSLMLFKVREIHNDLGQLRRIDLSFPCRDEVDRAGLMPMVVWLRSIVRQMAVRAADAAHAAA